MKKHFRGLIVLSFLLTVAGCTPREDSEHFCLGDRLKPGRKVSQQVWGERGGCDFEYEGKAGEVITIRVTSRTRGLDPQVQLLDPKGNKEASDDDSGGNGNPLIARHVLRRSGLYTISIAADNDQAGEVSILLERGRG